MTSIADTLQQQLPSAVIAAQTYRGQEIVWLKREALLETCRRLKDDAALAFDMLMDLTCADYLTFGQAQTSRHTLSTPSPLPYFMTPKSSKETWHHAAGEGHRFELLYNLYSLSQQRRLLLKVPLTAEEPIVDSVTAVWLAANWYEREVWDMFGIRFQGHPNLKRILLYPEFQGHPLRKDYPVNKRQPLVGPVN